MPRIPAKWWWLTGAIGLIVAFLVLGILMWWGSTQDQQWDTPVTENRSIQNVNQIDFSGVGEIAITQDGTESLQLIGPANALPRVQTKMRKSTLVITFQSLPWWNPINWFRRAKPPIRYLVHVKDLSQIDLKGNSKVAVGTLKTKSFEIDVSGSSTVVVDDLQANVVRVSTSGAGQIKLSGSVQKQNVIITGSATYNTTGLQSQETYLQIGGAANVEVNATKVLDVEISGSGSVVYQGNPEQLRQRISGSGTLVKK